MLSTCPFIHPSIPLFVRLLLKRERYILKKNELISMQIGTSGPPCKGMNGPTQGK